MEPSMEVSHQQMINVAGDAKINKALKRTLLMLSCAMLAIGNCGGPLLLRLYYVRGGNRAWLSSWLETGGWPVILFPLVVSYLRRRGHPAKGGGGGSCDATRLFFMNPFVFIASAVIGILTGLSDYFYAYGVSLLPVSTSSLIVATQLAFTAIFAFLLVRQKFTPYSINSVALLTLGAVVLGLHISGDRPANESYKQYVMGFVMTIAAAATNGLALPLVELTYKKTHQTITFTLVMEMQMVISIFATFFCTVGMLINKDFQAIPREAREYELGEAKYYLVVAITTIVWQFFFLGEYGVIFYGSSLLAAVIITTLLPITEVLAFFFFQESFKPEKGISLALSLWGFASYFYGEFKASKKSNQIPVHLEICPPSSQV